jgi:hypothetical protein
VSSVYGAPRWKRLGVMSGALGRRSALSVVSWSVLSVAAQIGQNTSGFSPGMVGFSLGRVACRLEGAG